MDGIQGVRGGEMGELGTITESRYKLKDNTSRVELAPGCTMTMREFVEECYLEPGRENASRAANEGWWEGILDRITVREVLEAISNTKKSTAPGPSMVGIDMLKQLGEGHLEEVCEFLNQRLPEGRIPDNMNTAHIRLLPKTEAGFQMDKTRPIVLMETLAKLYERIIITRITSTLDKNQVLDLSQFGAMPRAGVAAPLRTVAEVLEDARVSGSELHLVSLDLKHAFDSQEYHSQYLSWKCLGAPEHLIRILINMDAGSKQPGGPGGEGATSAVLLGAGRKTETFTHGRGGRQGSVGGALKWVVFMHFWLAWVKRMMEGQGYEMAAGMGVELITQFFVDDSIWCAKSKAACQEMMRRNELFCKFHALYLNKPKTRYIRVNDTGGRVRWAAPTAEEPQGETIKPTGRTGAVPKKGRKLEQRAPDQPDIRTMLSDSFEGQSAKEEHEDGRVFKYLGVWFEAQEGWSKQIRVLQETHGRLMARFKHKKLSIEMIRYFINAKVIPSMLYPMQVAIVPDPILKGWDAAHRRAMREAAGIPASLPTHIYHLPVERGGLGIESIESLVHINLVKGDLIARCECDHDKLKSAHDTLRPTLEARSHQQEVVTAAWARHGKGGKGLVTGAINNAMTMMGMKITRTPVDQRWHAISMPWQPQTGQGHRQSHSSGQHRHTLMGPQFRNEQQDGDAAPQEQTARVSRRRVGAGVGLKGSNQTI